MKWNFDNDSFQNDNNDDFDKLCPICKQKLLEAKLEKINEINQYQQTQNDILLIEEIKKELEKIKKKKKHNFMFTYVENIKMKIFFNIFIIY